MSEDNYVMDVDYNVKKALEDLEKPNMFKELLSAAFGLVFFVGVIGMQLLADDANTVLLGSIALFLMVLIVKIERLIGHAALLVAASYYTVGGKK